MSSLCGRLYPPIFQMTSAVLCLWLLMSTPHCSASLDLDMEELEEAEAPHLKYGIEFNLAGGGDIAEVN